MFQLMTYNKVYKGKIVYFKKINITNIFSKSYFLKYRDYRHTCKWNYIILFT